MIEKQNIIFLGSGVSIESGLPGVSEISNEIFNGHYNFDKEATWDFKIATSNYKEDDQIKELRQLLKELENIDNELSKFSAPFKINDKVLYSGSLFKGKSTYEDLYYLVSEIHKSTTGLSTNSAINAVILYIEQNSNQLLKGENRDERIIYLGKICLQCVNYLDWLIPILLVHKKIEGLGLIPEIIRNSDSTNIITLNHDVIIEDLFEQNEIEYDDGFNGAKNYKCTLFSGFTKSSKVKLIKPHGSINWVYSDNTYGKLHEKPMKETLENQLSKPLTGTNKILKYNLGVYAEMFLEFQLSLKSKKQMIMSGYGWGDEGINMRLGSWLDKENTSLILLHENPESLKERSYLMRTNMDKLVKKGKIILIEKWLSKLEFDDFYKQ